MDEKEYFGKTRKRIKKNKQRTRPMPKAKQNYLEAKEILFQELEDNLVGYRRKFKFESAFVAQSYS